ncbi:54_t:CDS:1, partial [Racocetra fulgida]
MKKKRRIIHFEPSFSSNQTNSVATFQSNLKHANHQQRQNHKNILSYICILCQTEARFAGSSAIRNILSAGNHNKQTQVINVTTTTPISVTQTPEVS